MTNADRCFVAECDRGAAASVTRPDLAGPLRLCATHTEQFRQSSDGWGITWPPGDPAPTSVTAPSSAVLWAYRPDPASAPAQVAAHGGADHQGRSGLSSRAAGWLGSRRSGKGRPPK
jgi:hypothetical protein